MCEVRSYVSKFIKYRNGFYYIQNTADLTPEHELRFIMPNYAAFDRVEFWNSSDRIGFTYGHVDRESDDDPPL